MRIKELELQGFKSFVDRTKLIYTPGITAIVGPNGCGKSNIVDAIRWVMGEISAKSLRGSSMEDVIFNGSDTRKPISMAEVRLIFDCEDGVVPAGFELHSQIEIARRLYRDGDSEYYLNRKPCRLKDIQSLLMDTGLGTKAYAVIEQGQIAKILQSKPEERRVLIEEAAGITKYKARKEEALRKIESTKLDLERVNDILAEITRNVNSLARQAGKAKRYKEAKAELKIVELELARRDLANLRERTVKLEQEFKELDQKIIANQAGLDAADTRMQTSRLDLLRAEKASSDVAEKRSLANQDLTSLENERQIRLDQISTSETRLQSAVNELAEIEQRIKKLEQERREAVAEKESINAEKQKNEIEFEKLASQVKDAKVSRENLQEKLEQLQRDDASLSSRKAVLVQAAATYLERKSEHQRRIDEESAVGKELEENRNKLSDELIVLDARLRTLDESRAYHEEKLATQLKKADALTKEVQSNKETFWEAKSKYEEAKVRLESLKTMKRNLEGFQEGVRRILMVESGLPEPEKRGILGLVADIIEVDRQYENALEAVLGERLQSVIVSSQQAGIDAVEFLKTQASGRSTFIPMEPRHIPRAHYPQETRAGALSPLLDLVRFKPEYEKVARYLCDNVLVVKDLQQAVLLHNANGYRGAFVTMEGEIVDPCGVITGGSAEALNSGILQKKREIEQLEGEIEDLETQFKSIEKKYFTGEGMLRNMENRIKTNKAELDESRVKITEALGEHRRHEAEISKLAREIEAHKSIQKRHIEKLESMESLSKAEADELALLGPKLEELEINASDLREKILAISSQIEKLSIAHTEISVQLARCIERFKAAESKEDQAVKQSRLETENASRRREEIRLLNQTSYEAKQLIGMLEERIKTQLDLAQKLSAEASVAGARVEEVRTELANAEAALRTISKDLESLKEAKNHLEMNGLEIRMKLENLGERIIDRYGVTLEELPNLEGAPELDRDALYARTELLNNKIASMGDVNMAAIEEYAAEKDRLEFTQKQHKDLTDAINDLKQAIVKINKESRERLMETFDKVQKRFAEVIPVLFGGGSGILSLTESDDVLDAGLEIHVRPPGKKLTSVNLLSGGEKALVSIGLIFSIFLVKPSPFCLLDEVDAPLDDANIDRFNDMIRKLSERSQIILITHNKRTMEVAKALYGITMEEAGASKIITVRFE